MQLTIVYLFLAVLLIGALPAHAQSAEELAIIQSELEAQDEVTEQLAATEAKTEGKLNSLQQKLVKATEALTKQQSETETLSDSLGDLEKAIVSQNKKLAADRSTLNDLLAALAVSKSQSSPLDALDSTHLAEKTEREAVIQATLAAIAARHSSIEQSLSQLQSLKTKATQHQEKLTARQQALRQEQEALEKLISERQGQLQQTTAQKAAAEKTRDTLAAEARNLGELIEKVSQRPGNFAKPQSKGKLPTGWRMPAAGRIIRNYGSKDEFGVTSNGVTLAVPGQSPIIAPRAGKVAFAGPFRGYGHIVILQHEGDYHSFLAGFGTLQVAMGQSVAAGEPLGLMPAKKDPRPELYFELRRKGEAIDPFATERTQKAGTR